MGHESFDEFGDGKIVLMVRGQLSAVGTQLLHDSLVLLSALFAVILAWQHDFGARPAVAIDTDDSLAIAVPATCWNEFSGTGHLCGSKFILQNILQNSLVSTALPTVERYA